jgi:hypothetical protein
MLDAAYSSFTVMSARALAAGTAVQKAAFRPHLHRVELIGDCPALSRGALGHMSETEFLLKPKAVCRAGSTGRGIYWHQAPSVSCGVERQRPSISIRVRDQTA